MAIFKNNIINNKTFNVPYMSDERTSAPYDYHYNDMGFRGEDIKRYIGKEVELCIGDSILFNLGDSVENSWPNQLNNM